MLLKWLWWKPELRVGHSILMINSKDSSIALQIWVWSVLKEKLVRLNEEESAVWIFLGAYTIAIQFRLKRRGQKEVPHIRRFEANCVPRINYCPR